MIKRDLKQDLEGRKKTFRNRDLIARNVEMGIAIKDSKREQRGKMEGEREEKLMGIEKRNQKEMINKGAGQRRSKIHLTGAFKDRSRENKTKCELRFNKMSRDKGRLCTLERSLCR